MEKEIENKDMSKAKYALIIGMLIGLIVGVSGTYVFMKAQENEQQAEFEQEKLGITEKLSLEITKLGLKNQTYTYVDKIHAAIADYNANTEEKENFKKIGKGMFALDASGVFYEVDLETNERVVDGLQIKGIDFEGKQPLENTVIIVTEKGKIEEATFLVEGFQIKYNLIGTVITQNGEKEKSN